MVSKVVDVAVAVILDARQRILIALRPDNSHQGGLWEFPGGKLEPGETVQQALVRELQEELAIRAVCFKPLIEIYHDYGDKSVHLNVWQVDRFEGHAIGREGQPLKWVQASQLKEYCFPEANKPIIKALLNNAE